MNTADILNKAAELMIERGHCKQQVEDQKGRVCLIGAVNLAISTSSVVDWGAAFVPADAALHAVLGDDFLARWNDRSETTEAMVVGALHDAALYAKENGL